MKVIHIINSLSTGGAEKLILDSLSLYIDRGLLIDLAVLKSSGESEMFEFEFEKSFKGRMFRVGSGSVYNPILIFRLIKFMRSYDVIHAHLFPTLYWVVLAKVISFSKVKIVFTEHNTSNRRRKILVFKYLDRFIYSFLSFIGCISISTKANLKEHLKNSKIPIEVISNGIDLNKFNDLNNELNLNKITLFDKKSDFILIQISSFRKQKDQNTLIKALTYLSDNVKLLLVGDGNLREEKENYVEELGLSKRVKFLGNRSDISELLHYSDVCILSSFYEGFGLVIVEGMACSKPVIASDVEGIREIVKGHGLLVKAQDSEDLANKINKLYNDKEFYLKVANRCAKRAQDFSINNMVNQYYSVYERVFLNK